MLNNINGGDFDCSQNCYMLTKCYLCTEKEKYRIIFIVHTTIYKGNHRPRLSAAKICDNLPKNIISYILVNLRNKKVTDAARGAGR